MKRKRNFARNVAIFGVFVVLTGVAGTGSWMSAAHRPSAESLSMAVRSAALPQLTGAFEVVEAAPAPPKVKYLDAEETSEDGVRLSYPNTPTALAEAAKSWVDDQVGASDGAGELEVSFEPVFAAGEYLGVRMSSTLTNGPDRTAAEQVIVMKVGSDQAWFVQDLVSEEARQQWAAYVRQATKAGALDIDHPSVDQAARMVEEGLPRGQFTAEGFRLPLPASDTALVIRDPSAMNADGVKLARALEAAEQFVGLPAPEPADSKAKDALTFPGEDGIDCAQEKCIALTFDDGPEPGTRRLLDILAQEQARSTFFLIGRQISAHQETVQRMVDEGHIVGNHTWTHLELPRQTPAQVREQIDRTRAAIIDAGAPPPTLFRPPYGALSDAVRREIAGLGYATILWDADTLDWQTRDTRKIIDAALADARPGGIILMHDIHQETIDAVPEIIKKLRKDGFTLVTVPELFGGEVRVGGVYLNNH